MLGCLCVLVLAADEPAHTHERAGNPQVVSRWAVPSRSPHHAGGWVGGGRLSLFGGDGRATATDGTFG